MMQGKIMFECFPAELSYCEIPRGQLKQDIDGGDAAGRSPAHWVAFNGNSECLKVLLLANADPNKEDNSGRTPLHWAAFNNHAGIIKILLNSDASPNVVNHMQVKPLSMVPPVRAMQSASSCCSKPVLTLMLRTKTNGLHFIWPQRRAAPSASSCRSRPRRTPTREMRPAGPRYSGLNLKAIQNAPELLKRYGETSSGASSQTCGEGCNPI